MACPFEPYAVCAFAGFGRRSVTRIFWLKFDIFLIFCNDKSQGRRQSGVKFGKGGLTIYMEHSSEKLVGTKSKLARLGACLLLFVRSRKLDYAFGLCHDSRRSAHCGVSRVMQKTDA